MRRLFLAVGGLMLVAVPAQAMSVAEFLAKVNALKAKGALAMFSSDIGLLKQEVDGASAAYRADLAAAAAAGKRPSSCPPTKGQVKMSSSELIAAFEKIPPARRSISVKTAFAAVMQQRFPCK
ncbi:hypothetical protein [Sphingomonas elodea]|uniref:hypothetical protein n=1 Tax=Sphingomonas elodea TaxID=179878 RepID=UPI0002631013|nr:hypothetical protein [Sphingomonas elodea]